MLFDSIQYFLFLPVVFGGYFACPHRFRWLWLLVASYGFYMSYEPIYGLLLLGSTSLDYWLAIIMERLSARSQRKKYLYLSILGNIGTLFVFKYLDFFTNICSQLLGLFVALEPTQLNLLLPIGISFYTFQSLGYTIDVYRGDRQAEQHFGIFALYVSFFPQLVAGPIERSTTLLPQFYRKQNFSWLNLISGLKLVLWGLFKKIAIADQIGHYVNLIYSNPNNYDGFSWVLVGAGFSVQVLLDFGAYTDIAIGSAKLFGIDLSINFRQPFRSTNMQEFWRRWHISLTSWFYEYLYKPLGRRLRMGWQWNMLIFMTVVGFWHGPSLGFLLFGLIHGGYYIASDYLPRFASERSKILDYTLKVIAISGVFIFSSISTYFFRAESIETAFYGLTRAVKSLLFFNFCLDELALKTTDSLVILMNMALFITIQNLRNHDPKNPFSSIAPLYARWAIYFFMLLMIISLSHTAHIDFIYFHF